MTRRQEQARATREAILEVARRRFLRDGFTSTTIGAIADDAGVSVETIYKAFGGKPGLVRAICERALEGAGPVPAETRSDALQKSESDPRKILRGFGELSTEVAPRIAPLLLLLRSAGEADARMARLRADLDERRLERMTANARRLAEHHRLKEGLTVERAGEIGWIYSSPELYELLVVRRKWPLSRFGAFIGDALVAALLPP